MRPRGDGEGLPFADPAFNWSLILPVEEYCRSTGRPPASTVEWRIAISTEVQDRVRGLAFDVIYNDNVKWRPLQHKYDLSTDSHVDDELKKILCYS